jgi:hypothetical protein
VPSPNLDACCCFDLGVFSHRPTSAAFPHTLTHPPTHPPAHCPTHPDKESKPKPGEAMLEQYRKAGKPIPPQVEKMAAWLDKMDAESAQDVPMVKPGVCCFSFGGGGDSHRLVAHNSAEYARLLGGPAEAHQ